MELLVLIQGSGAINGQFTKAGDVWYLEADIQEIVLSGKAILLSILP
jgi:hypothetical protein